MNKIDENKVKELSFDGCTLSPEAGSTISEAIKKNKTLEYLEVCSSQLGSIGMMAVLSGLKENTSIKTFRARSYNVESYYWSHRELNSLAEVITNNSTLEKIELPNNQLNDFSDITTLSQPYKEIKHRLLASISGFEVSKSSYVPDICAKNMEALDELSQDRFINRHY
ncbi:hypothetical protein ACQUW5_13130 [Legionella sp. CNM-1927-20]|uniref:hypothetical protein n=1 Tax=Legionella sp. CNM-1927-20 TaxID=3422221 RepID=UPI00403A8E59